MLSRIARNLIRNENFGRVSTTRTIITSKDSFQQQPLVNNKEDITIYSPFPSIDYPNLSIDQYVWADVNKWANKTAVVCIQTY